MRRIFIGLVAVSWLMCGAARQVKAEPVYALTVSNRLISFDSATPGATSTRNITGLRAGEQLVGIDFRPADGRLYGVSTFNTLYTIDLTTGAVTQASILSVTLNVASVGGANLFGVDFNPTVDRLRVVSATDQNLRINVDTGEAAVDGTLGYAAGDQNAGSNPNIASAAYTNNFVGATSTVLYGIDTNLRTLVTQNPANAGTLTTIGALGINFASFGGAGFDISGTTGTAYAALPLGVDLLASSFYTINLETGAATLVGSISGTSNNFVRGIAVAPAAAPIPEPATILLFGTGLAGGAARLHKRRKAGRGRGDS